MFYSIYYYIRRLCPTSHGDLAKDYGYDGGMLADTIEALLKTMKGSNTYMSLYLLHIHIYI